MRILHSVGKRQYWRIVIYDGRDWVIALADHFDYCCQ